MLTPLERPADYRNKPYFTPDEAAAFERTLQQARKTRQEQSARGGIIGMGLDEEIWTETGTLARISGRFPTALIVDPSDGRRPP